MVYTYCDILEALNKLHIHKGDNLFIHSNLGYFGKLENCTSGDEICNKFFQAIIDFIGDEGTLVVPTFTYSFCHGELFDLYETKTKCGIFPEYVRKIPGAIRSADPNFSIAAYGANKYLFTEHVVNESFGKDSFWERFMNADGKIMCMNYDCGSTFVHYAERQNNVTYRYNKAFNGVMKINDEFKKDYFVHYVYEIEEDAPYMDRLNKLCRENNICRSVLLGRGAINLLDSKEYYKLICETLVKEPRFLTKGGNL